MSLQFPAMCQAASRHVCLYPTPYFSSNESDVFCASPQAVG